MPTSYNIIISEAQRQLIEEALTLHSKADLAYPKEAFEELDLLLSMVAELPKEEALTPGVTHGLCL